MATNYINELVAAANTNAIAKVAAAIENDGRSEKAIAEASGISQGTLRRKLAGLNGASFTVTELALLAHTLDMSDSNPFVPAAA